MENVMNNTWNTKAINFFNDGLIPNQPEIRTKTSVAPIERLSKKNRRKAFPGAVMQSCVVGAPIPKKLAWRTRTMNMDRILSNSMFELLFPVEEVISVSFWKIT